MKKTKALSFIAALLLSCQLAACSGNSTDIESDEVKDMGSSSETILDDTAEGTLSSDAVTPVLPIYADSDELNDAYKITFTHDYGFDGLREKKDCQFWDSYIMDSTSEVTYFFYSEYADTDYGFRVEYDEGDYYLNSGVWFYSKNTAKTNYSVTLSDSFVRKHSDADELFFYDFFEALNEEYYDTDTDNEDLWYCHSVAAEDDSSFGLGNSNYYSFKVEPIGGCGSAFSFRENNTYFVIDPEKGYVLETNDIWKSDYADSIYSLICDEAAQNEYIWLDSLKDCIYTDQFSWYVNSDKQFVISFETGMVAPFSAGNVEYAIDLSDASPYLTAYGKALAKTSTYLSYVSIDTNKPIAYYTECTDILENHSSYIRTTAYNESDANALIEKMSGYNIIVEDKDSKYDHAADDIVYCEATPFIAPNTEAEYKNKFISVRVNNKNDYDVTIDGLSLFWIDDENNTLPVIFSNRSCVYQLDKGIASHSEYSFDISEDILNYMSLTTGKYKLVLRVDGEYVVRNLFINCDLVDEDGTDGWYSREMLNFLTDEQYDAFKAECNNHSVIDRGSRLDFKGVSFKLLKSTDDEIIFKSVNTLCFDDYPEIVYYEDDSFSMIKTSNGWKCDVFNYWL